MQLTPWRNRLAQIPSSFSPDGSRLAFTRYVADKPPEALAMEFNGSADTVLSRNAIEPVYSPDGLRIAFLRGPVKTVTKRRHDGSSSSVSVTSAWSNFTPYGSAPSASRTRSVRRWWRATLA